jgi:proton-translocating NADH-quinone oxidoreductase chain M
MQFFYNFQIIILSFPLFIIFCLSFIKTGSIRQLRNFSLITNLILLNFLMIDWLLFYFNVFNVSSLNFDLTYLLFKVDSLFNLTFKIDIISLSFLILTCFLINICLLISWQWLSFFYSLRFYLILLLFIEFFSFNFFSVDSLFFFYIFFESVLIPMYFLIGIWGLRQRKIHASYQFFIYTFAGSLLMLISIIALGYSFNSYQISFFEQNLFLFSNLSFTFQLLLWSGFFIAFAIKTPMVPVHIWLPEAHVEAPTAGSVILAGLLLKFGTYGFYKILINIFYLITNYLFWFLISLSFLAIIYGSIITYSQIDFKKIIAYSSVSHMGYVIYGLILDNVEGILGALLMMFTHGFISSALFYSVGILYERYGTRNIFDYGGLKNFMPIFTFFFFCLTLANLNLPMTAGFISEFLVLLGSAQLESFIIILIGALGVFTNGVYCIWLFNRLCMGPNLIINSKKMEFNDLEKRETFILSIFCIIICLLGIFPNCLLLSFEPFIFQILWQRLI